MKKEKVAKEKKKKVYLVLGVDGEEKHLVSAFNRKAALNHLRGEQPKVTVTKPSMDEIFQLAKDGVELEQAV